MSKLEQSSTVESVVAVIVTYNPSLERLAQVLHFTRLDCQFTIVVDNGSSPEAMQTIVEILGDGQQVFTLGENLGIAAAQNAGLAWARNAGVSNVLLLDQDSIPTSGMVTKLVAHSHSLVLAGIKVAAVGPRLTDKRWDSRNRLAPKGRSTSHTNLLEVDHVIASGALIRLATFDVVGSMKSELFIDYVDIEWGLRAQKLGYHSFIASDVEMDHQLGDLMIVFGRTISTHRPMRHYYMVRNSIWLLRQDWLPNNWRYIKVPKIVLHLLINAFFAKPRHLHWKMMMRGLRHGLTNRMGRGHD